MALTMTDAFKTNNCKEQEIKERNSFQFTFILFASETLQSLLRKQLSPSTTDMDEKSGKTFEHNFNEFSLKENWTPASNKQGPHGLSMTPRTSTEVSDESSKKWRPKDLLKRPIDVQLKKIRVKKKNPLKKLKQLTLYQCKNFLRDHAPENKTRASIISFNPNVQVIPDQNPSEIQKRDVQGEEGMDVAVNEFKDISLE